MSSPGTLSTNERGGWNLYLYTPVGDKKSIYGTSLEPVVMDEEASFLEPLQCCVSILFPPLLSGGGVLWMSQSDILHTQ